MGSKSQAAPPRFRELVSDPGARWLMLVSALIPASVLLFFLSQNSTYASFRYVLLTAGICVVITAILWLCVLALLRNPLAATLFFLLLWTGVFFESQLHLIIIRMFRHVGLFYVFWFLMAFALAYLLRKLNAKGPFSFLLCAFITVFFSISAVNTAISFVSGLNTEKAAIKTDFIVSDDISDRPNVYWIHCDGMMSFDAIEKYFDDRQDGFRDALTKRDFLINEEACVPGCATTTVAVPALMSPNFYDQYLSELLADPDTAAQKTLSDKAQGLLRDARLNNETFQAFTSAGYSTYTVALLDQYFFPTTDAFYYPVDPEAVGAFTYSIYHASPFVLAKMDKLTAKQAEAVIEVSENNTFMNSFFRPGANLFGSKKIRPGALFGDYATDTDFLAPSLSDDRLREIFLGSEPAALQHSYFVDAIEKIRIEAPQNQPRFTLLMSLMFHYPYVFDANGNRPSSISVADAKNYYGQHVFYSKVLVNVIDMILADDPDAVIILQADHAMNTHYDSELDESFGIGQYDSVDLRSSMMSAIRVPEKYRNGEEVYALENPLNMSRYIVNRFVGRNYEYLEHGP